MSHPVADLTFVQPAPLVLRGRVFDAGHPAVMAIVNRTDDSFFAGNRHADLDSAMRALDEAVDEGADIVDVGGVRAGQEGEPVSAAEEIDRVLPFLERARAAYPDLVLESRHLAVARSRGPLRPRVSTSSTTRGRVTTPSWWASRPSWEPVSSCRTPAVSRRAPTRSTSATDLTRSTWCATSSRPWRAAPRQPSRPECRAERILVDPTLDFGKTTAHSLQVLRHTADVVALGFPVLQALSRKDFVGESLDLPADERLEGSLAATAVAAWLGATVFRAHDVRATRRTADMVATIRGDRTPRLAVRGVPREP